MTIRRKPPEFSWTEGMGGVLIGVAAVIVIILTQNQDKHAEQRTEVAHHKVESLVEGTRTSCATLGYPESLFCVAKALEIDREDRERQYDLQAQQEMADWAIVVGLSTLAGLMVSGVGLWALFRTLEATREANIGFQASAERQLRAYLFPRNFVLRGADKVDPGPLVWRIKNHGATPAYKVRHYAQMLVCDNAKSESIKFDDVQFEEEAFVIAPHSTTRFFIPHPLTEEEWAEVKAGSKTLVLAGVIIYRDAFKRTRRTVFQMLLRNDFDQGKKSIRFTAASEHNNAS